MHCSDPNVCALTGAVVTLGVIFYSLFTWPKAVNGGPMLACIYPLNSRDRPVKSFIFLCALIVIALGAVLCRTDFRTVDLCIALVGALAFSFIWFEPRKKEGVASSKKMRVHVPIVFISVLCMLWILFTWNEYTMVVALLLLLYIPFIGKAFASFLEKRGRGSAYNWIWYSGMLIILTTFFLGFATTVMREDDD